MDDLTAERFGVGVPKRETRTQPSTPPPVRRQPKPLDPERREVLAEMIRALASVQLEPAWMAANRRLVEAIRRTG